MTSDLTSAPPALAEVKAELARLRAELGGGGQGVGQDRPDSYDEALERAALCGCFALDRLTDFAPEEDRLPLRSALSRVSEPVRTTPPRLHSLTRDQRQATLGRLLLEPERLVERLDEDRFPRPDGVGQALRELLRVRIGAADLPDIARIETERLENLMIAAGWMEPLGGPVPSVTAIRTELAGRSLDEWIEELLPDGLVGRDDLLGRIESFARNEPMQGSGILVIDGIGGVGKSALIAEAIRRLRRQKHAVIYFDLDRPALDPRTTGFTLEFLRQLALFAPARAEDLKRIRGNLRQTFERTAIFSVEGIAESSYKAELGASSLIRPIITEAGLSDQPLCLFIDTFEVAMTRGAATVELVRDWIHTARRLFGAENLRAVVAGRAASDAALALDATEVQHIPDLPFDDAVTLLRRLDVEAGGAERLAEVFGGNPLVLRLVARFLRANPQVSISDLTAPGGVPEADAEIVQGVLYQRILGHIGEGPESPLRRIAYPGLALRVVTPTLIREVLGPVLDIQLDRTSAGNLWQRLVEQAWLVSRRGPEVAEHRRDLRRMMVRVMTRDRKNAEVVRELHRRAAAYHEAGRDPHMTSEEMRAEAIYHRLMILEPGEDVDLGDPGAISLAVGNDIDDLSPAGRTLVHYHLSWRISLEEAALLPARFVRPWSMREGWWLLDENSVVAAMRLAAALREGVNDRYPPVWELTAIHRTAGWYDPETGARLDAVEAAVVDGTYYTFDDSYNSRETRMAAFLALSLLRFERGEHGGDRLPQAARRSWPIGESGLSSDTDTPAAMNCMTFRLLSAAFGGPVPDDDDEVTVTSLLDMFRKRPFNGPFRLAGARLIAVAQLTWPERSWPIILLPEMIRPTPLGREKLMRLVTNLGRAVPPRLDGFLELAFLPRHIRRLPNSGELLNGLAVGTAEAYEGVSLDVSDLLAAGMTPNEILAGLNHEQLPVARHVLSQALQDDATLARFAERLPDVLGERQADRGLFLPADFEPEAWLRAARESPARTFSALVLWSQRVMALGAVVALARELSGPGDGSLDRLARSLRRWEAAIDGLLKPEPPWGQNVSRTKRR